MRTLWEAALLAVAIGDALGFPFEGEAPENLKDFDPSFYRAGSWPPGTWSDDTSLTFITAESLISRKRLDLEDLGHRFLKWLHEGYFTPFGQAIGVGRATREALLRLAQGVPPTKAGGRGERDNGNGALMRLLPVVLWYHRAEENLFLARVHEAASLTHAHPRNLLACGLYAFVVREVLKGLPFREALTKALEQGFSFYSRSPWIRELKFFEPLGQIFLIRAPEIRASGYVVHTLEAVCWVLGQSTSFLDALRLAISLGGDTDTIAAITGGLAALLYGPGDLPETLVQGLVRSELLTTVARNFAEALNTSPWVDSA